MTLRFDLTALTELRQMARLRQLEMNRAVHEFDAPYCADELRAMPAAERIAKREALYNRWRVWQTLEKRFNHAHLVCARADAKAA